MIYLTPGLINEGEPWFSIIRNDVNTYQTMKEHLFTTVKVLAVALDSTARETEIKVYGRIMQDLQWSEHSWMFLYIHHSRGRKMPAPNSMNELHCKIFSIGGPGLPKIAIWCSEVSSTMSVSDRSF